MTLSGRVEHCDEASIKGWAAVADHPGDKLHLDLLYGDTVIGRCVADKFRTDLHDAGIGDCHCGFEFAMPRYFPKSETRRLRIRVQETGEFLLQGNDVTGPRETFSRFGGFWVDRNDFIDRLAFKQQRGEISDQLSVAISRFARDGYVVIENAVPTGTIDRLNADIDRMWSNPPKGALIETFKPDGKQKNIRPVLEYRGQSKLLDVYPFSAVAREAIASPKVIAFLTAILEEKPKAFQGLSFWNGSEQSIHKDTAYVKIDTNPMHILASWLALEDVQPGSGELEYYVGSHRAPDFLFGGASKWMASHPEEHSKFLESLHKDAEAYHHVKSSFLGKRGDVLVWHGDLAHGGAPITKPGQTRKSLVTHFTAASDEPYYRRWSQYRALETDNCVFVSEYANVPEFGTLRKLLSRRAFKYVIRRMIG